ncbi:MAG TPA: hypothetical protein VFW34_09475 [Candidatus Rubrimentiphilum sp.]|nr:hypothetical protein [Candidatus Rubrimentiphilum sp.]
MNPTKALGIAALTGMLAAAISVAYAQTLKQTPGSQISVSQCSPHQHQPGVGAPHPWVDPYGILHTNVSTFPYAEGFLAITYANQASKAATEVDFGLVSRGYLIAVVNDAGTFSPNVPIAHEFSVSPEIFPIGTSLPYCAVMRVKYADGTEWRNPNPPEE